MHVAITVFGSTISPTFDSARRLLLAEVAGAGIRPICEAEIEQLDLAGRVSLLLQQRVRVLVCGGISEFSHNALMARGVEVYAWVSGEVDEVLQILALRLGARPTRPHGSRRLAIPSTGPDLSASVAPSFRCCSHLIFVETHDLRSRVERVTEGLAGVGGCQLLARAMVEAQAQVLLTGRCGPNALGLLAVAGVQVIQGVSGKLKAVAAAYAAGELTP